MRRSTRSSIDGRDGWLEGGGYCVVVVRTYLGVQMDIQNIEELKRTRPDEVIAIYPSQVVDSFAGRVRQDLRHDSSDRGIAERSTQSLEFNEQKAYDPRSEDFFASLFLGPFGIARNSVLALDSVALSAKLNERQDNKRQV
jgi:hypothetical protein